MRSGDFGPKPQLPRTVEEASGWQRAVEEHPHLLHLRSDVRRFW